VDRPRRGAETRKSHVRNHHDWQQEATFFASCIELLVKLKFFASSQYKSRANPVQQNLPEFHRLSLPGMVHLHNEWRLA